MKVRVQGASAEDPNEVRITLTMGLREFAILERLRFEHLDGEGRERYNIAAAFDVVASRLPQPRRAWVWKVKSCAGTATDAVRWRLQ